MIVRCLIGGALAVALCLTAALGYVVATNGVSIGSPFVTDLGVEPSPPTVGPARISFRLWTPWGEVIGGSPVKIVPRTAGVMVIDEVTQTPDDAFVATVRFETTGDCVFDIVVLRPDGSAWWTIPGRIDDIEPAR